MTSSALSLSKSPEPQAPMVATLLQCWVSLRLGGAQSAHASATVPRRVRPVAVISARPWSSGSAVSQVWLPRLRRQLSLASPKPRQWSPSVAEPDGTPVQIDTSTFAPGTTGRHPALLLAHGFGGSKADLDTQAKRYAAQGWVVVTYTARGFGGLRWADPPRRPRPRGRRRPHPSSTPSLHGTTSDSTPPAIRGWRWPAGPYGGALALMLGATDPRIDGIVASITWNDLALSLSPAGAPGRGRPTHHTGAN